MRSILLIAAMVSFIAFGSVSAQTSVTTDYCYDITWYGGAASTMGKTVKGHLKQNPYIIRYEWKNGIMNYNWISDGGRAVGIKGTWKQDGSNGTFDVRITDDGNGYEGHWSSAGNPAKHKLIFKNCK